MVDRSFLIGALSDTGDMRETNEDSILVKIGKDAHGEFGLFAVADGLGGLSHGGIASGIAVDGLKEWWDTRLLPILSAGKYPEMGHIGRELDEAVAAINRKVIAYGHRANAKTASTLSLLFIYRDRYYIRHAGDSRVYAVNQTITCLTEDHSWVSQQMREGRMTERQAENHPGKSILTKCIGITEKVGFFKRQGDVRSGDIFLLCSDGLHNTLSDAEIFQAFTACKSHTEEEMQEIAAGLLNRVKVRGARDNTSMILVCQYSDDYKEKFIDKLKRKLFAKYQDIGEKR